MVNIGIIKEKTAAYIVSPLFNHTVVQNNLNHPIKISAGHDDLGRGVITLEEAEEK